MYGVIDPFIHLMFFFELNLFFLFFTFLCTGARGDKNKLRVPFTTYCGFGTVILLVFLSYCQSGKGTNFPIENIFMGCDGVMYM